MSKQQLLSNLGRKIAAVREFRGITQTRLADRLYVNKSCVSRIEGGKQDPGILIFAIAIALECKVDTFNPYSPNVLIIPESMQERVTRL